MLRTYGLRTKLGLSDAQAKVHVKATLVKVGVIISTDDVGDRGLNSFVIRRGGRLAVLI